VAKHKLTITEPLVDENFNELPAAKEFIANTSNEEDIYEVHFEISSRDMVPTAMFFALKSRFNITFTANIGEFPANYYVFSFLKSSHLIDVKMKGINE